MDKIDFTAASLINPSGLNSPKPGIKKAKTRDEIRSKNLFSRFLEQAAPQAADLGPLMEFAPSEEALTELMDAVHSSGSDLIDRPFAEEIVRYKKAVRNFINYVVENSFDMEEIVGFREKKFVRGEAIWEGKKYNQIKVIDQKLEELAANILSGQTTQLQRISKLEELKGLLVDLTIKGVIKERDD